MSKISRARVSENAEQAVRNYLKWLDDPSSMRDQEAIDATKKKLDASDDPIERLKAASQLEALETIDGDTYRAEFVQQAKTWADENNVSIQAFRSQGVSAADLRDAGFAVAGTAGPKRAKRASTGAKKRKGRVNPDEVRASLPSTTFRIQDAEASSGASTATVRKVITQMVAEGKLHELGPDPDHHGRGRAPILYTPV